MKYNICFVKILDYKINLMVILKYKFNYEFVVFENMFLLSLWNWLTIHFDLQSSSMRLCEFPLFTLNYCETIIVLSNVTLTDSVLIFRTCLKNMEMINILFAYWEESIWYIKPTCERAIPLTPFEFNVKNLFFLKNYNPKS